MIFHLRDLLSQHLLRLAAQKITGSGTDEGVPFLEVDYQNQVGETFQQSPAEFLLLRQLPFHLSLFGDVNQRSLITNDVPRSVPNRSGGIEEDCRRSLFAPESDLAGPDASAVVNRPPQNRRSGIEIERCGFDAQQI